jgi:hypothetical protein
MRPMLFLILLGLGACAQQSGPAPCNPPMFIDSTGECVSEPYLGRRR